MSHVLLVEPDKLLAENYQKALQHAGHTVTWAKTGQAGVHAADEHTPEVIVLELQMPGHNGVEFLYELRSYPEWQNIPVLLLTMVPDRAVTTEQPVLQQLGVAGYLYKPQTKLRHVVRAVNHALEHASV